VTTTAAILKCRLHPILPEVKAQLEKIRERILIVCVDGHPLRTLGGGVNGVKTDGDIAFEVAVDCVKSQAEPLAGFPVLGTIVVVSGTFWMRAGGLEGVGPPVYEEAEVIRHHAGRRNKTMIAHSLLAYEKIHGQDRTGQCYGLEWGRFRPEIILFVALRT